MTHRSLTGVIAIMLTSSINALSVAGASGSAPAVDYDATLSKELKIMSRYTPYSMGKDADADKVLAASGRIKSDLLKWANQSELMNAKLPHATQEAFSFVESKDHNLRIYSWDNLTGGTMHYFDAVAQFKSAGKLYGKSLISNPGGETDPGISYSSIETVRTKAGDTVYLVQGTMVGSSVDRTDFIIAYSIANGALKKVKFFKPKGPALDTISCDSPHQLPNQDSELPSITLEDKNNTLKVPLVTKEDSFAGNYLIYRFDGTNFVYKSIGK